MTRCPVRFSFAAALAVILLALGSGLACKSSPPAPSTAATPKPKPKPKTQAATSTPASPESTAAVAEGINLFTLDLYRSLSSQPGNLILSPASVYLGLAQVMAGARNQTAAEFHSALHVSLSDEAFHSAFGALYSDLVGRGGGDFKLKWASRLWARDGFEVLPAYTSLLQETYDTTAGRFDSPAVAGEINDWVAEQTEKEIPEVIKPDQITDKSLVLLVNAIFFHGFWQNQFPAEATRPAPFHLLAGESVPVPTMYLRTEALLGSGDGYRFLTLGYKGGGMAMTILLPDQPDGLPALEGALDWKKLKAEMEAASSQKVDVGLPRFKFESKLELTENLRAGLPTAFDERSDLFGIGDPRPDKYLYLSSVIHVAKVEVEETGTKAAAATVVVVNGGPPSVEPRPQEFYADHPFLFLIHDAKTGAVLFIGRVQDPRG